MTLYELARVDITEFKPGAVLQGRSTVLIHIQKGINSRQGWVSPKPFQQCVELSSSKVFFLERCYFVRINPIGLSGSDITNGELDFELSVETIGRTLGKNIVDQLMRICRMNGSPVAPYTVRVIFIGAFTHDDSGKWQFIGCLPMDGRLQRICLTAEEIGLDPMG